MDRTRATAMMPLGDIEAYRRIVDTFQDDGSGMYLPIISACTHMLDEIERLHSFERDCVHASRPRCTSCLGTGHRRKYLKSGELALIFGIDCPKCDGTGTRPKP